MVLDAVGYLVGSIRAGYTEAPPVDDSPYVALWRWTRQIFLSNPDALRQLHADPTSQINQTAVANQLQKQLNDHAESASELEPMLGRLKAAGVKPAPTDILQKEYTFRGRPGHSDTVPHG